MSNRCHTDAVLRSWHGPFFPPTLADLQTAYAEWVARLGGLNSCRLASIGEPLKSYQKPIIIETNDGYKWARGPVYKIKRDIRLVGLVRILFPHCTDEARSDGTPTDRSIAVYASNGYVTAVELAEVVREYRQQFVQETMPRLG